MSDSDALAPTPAHGNDAIDDEQNQIIDEDAEQERAAILKQLEILHAKGILDDDEFNTKIQRLYGKDA
jgi:Flp pilus assembly CpaE family ATPase